MLKTFGALPTEQRARDMKARDYLWCALNLMLDREELMAQLCPGCRQKAEEACCPVCGAPAGETTAGQNASFDQERFERLMRGETT